jgi:hypothetical protein
MTDESKGVTDARERLEYLRGEIRAERISYGELAELQSLSDEIDPGDLELLEAAGIPEGVTGSPEELEAYRLGRREALPDTGMGRTYDDLALNEAYDRGLNDGGRPQ